MLLAGFCYAGNLHDDQPCKPVDFGDGIAVNIAVNMFYTLLVKKKKKHQISTSFHIWGWVKTLVPSEPQNSWDLWMFIPLKMYL